MSDWFSYGWLGLLVFVAIAYSLRLAMRSDYGVWESTLYLPTYLMGRLLWRVHFCNSAPPDLQRGGLLVANHRSSVDPFFIQLAAKRRVHWLVAKEFTRHPLFGPLLKLLEVIPTNRSGMDTAATKQAIAMTGAGKLVGMFPEGRINQSPQLLLPCRSGAALVALKSSVPLFPLYIAGSPYRRTVWSPLFMPARVQITFGEPIYPTSEGNSNAANELDDVQATDSVASSGHTQQGTTDTLIAQAMEESVAETSRPRQQRVQADAMMRTWEGIIHRLAGKL